MESRITYFEEVGPVNTQAVFAIVKARAAEAGVTHLVLASTTGDTDAPRWSSSRIAESSS